MTQIFLRFYAGVLIVLLVAWFIYGFIYEQRTDADVQRVILQAHRGGLAAVIENWNKTSGTSDRCNGNSIFP